MLVDIDGRFSIAGLAPGSYTLRAFRKGGGEAYAEDVSVGSTVILTVRPAGRIAGTATHPVAGAPDVIAITVRDKAQGFQRREEFFQTNGRWAIDDLEAGNYEITAEAAEGTAVTLVPLAQGQLRENIALALDARATLRGRVVDLETGLPVAGLEMMARSDKGGTWTTGDAEERKSVSDADGRWEIARAPSGRVYVLTRGGEDPNGARYGYAQELVTVSPEIVTEAPRSPW